LIVDVEVANNASAAVTQAASTAGAPRTAGGALAPSDAGGNTGTSAGQNGPDHASTPFGGGGEGAEGGAVVGGVPQGGTGTLTGFYGTTRNTTVEATMTPKLGGSNVPNAASNPGEKGRVEIIDGAGTTVYSTPGTYYHTVS
jgi:hypothetical protein